jgi:hypothetical protein
VAAAGGPLAGRCRVLGAGVVGAGPAVVCRRVCAPPKRSGCWGAPAGRLLPLRGAVFTGAAVPALAHCGGDGGRGVCRWPGRRAGAAVPRGVVGVWVLDVIPATDTTAPRRPQPRSLTRSAVRTRFWHRSWGPVAESDDVVRLNGWSRARLTASCTHLVASAYDC